MLLSAYAIEFQEPKEVEEVRWIAIKDTQTFVGTYTIGRCAPRSPITNDPFIIICDWFSHCGKVAASVASKTTMATIKRDDNMSGTHIL